MVMVSMLIVIYSVNGLFECNVDFTNVAKSILAYFNSQTAEMLQKSTEFKFTIWLWQFYQHACRTVKNSAVSDNVVTQLRK